MLLVSGGAIGHGEPVSAVDAGERLQGAGRQDHGRAHVGHGTLLTDAELTLHKVHFIAFRRENSQCY